MAEKDEKRTLTGDVKNFFTNKIKGNILDGDVSRYKIPDVLPEEAIKVTPKRIHSNKIEDENELEAAFNYAMEKAYEKNRLPTKYTKEGLLESIMMFNTGTMPAMLEKSAQDLKEREGYTKEEGPANQYKIKVPPKKREYIEGYSDIAKSI